MKLVHLKSYTDTASIIEDNSNDKIALAFYRIFYLIEKNSKPFSGRSFRKECLIEIVKAFGNTECLGGIKNIPLSDKTTASRLEDIGIQLSNKIYFIFFKHKHVSHCLDESINIRHTSQLSIYVRLI